MEIARRLSAISLLENGLVLTGVRDRGRSNPGTSGFWGNAELAIRGNSRHVPVMKSNDGLGAADEGVSKHGITVYFRGRGKTALPALFVTLVVMPGLV
jgi:hypothetical protein